MTPDFILIGAGKSGTTSIHAYLADHPQVCTNQKKELYYFTDSTTQRKMRHWGVIGSLQEYEEQFSHQKEGQKIIEVSTVYYNNAGAAKLIYEHNPNVKLLMILRDPSQRAFSDYMMKIRGARSIGPVEEELANPDSIMVRRGQYYSQIQSFLEYFPRENFRVFFFEDFVKDRKKFYESLCDFLGIEAILPQKQYHGRKGGQPKKMWLHKLLTKKNPIRDTAAAVMRRFVPAQQRQSLRTKLVKSNMEKARLPSATRAQLIDIYREEIDQLEQLLNVDLEHWKKI